MTSEVSLLPAVQLKAAGCRHERRRQKRSRVHGNISPGMDKHRFIIFLILPTQVSNRISPAQHKRLSRSVLQKIFAITDVNRDGVPDVLIGKATGALQYWQNHADNGMFDQLTMINGSYLGLGNSTSRQNPAVAVGDLDADGLDDLVMGDQRGTLSFYGDYRNFDIALSQPESNILFNSLTEEYGPGNFAGRIWPTVGNLFNSNKPAIMLGNTLGGLFVLRNDGSATLPDDPVVGVGPNPLERGNDLQIRSDRNTKVQIIFGVGPEDE